jgi:hypothetical protein
MSAFHYLRITPGSSDILWAASTDPDAVSSVAADAKAIVPNLRITTSNRLGGPSYHLALLGFKSKQRDEFTIQIMALLGSRGWEPFALLDAGDSALEYHLRRQTEARDNA